MVGVEIVDTFHSLIISHLIIQKKGPLLLLRTLLLGTSDGFRAQVSAHD